MKKCRICNAEKDDLMFALGKNSKGGRVNTCKACKAYRDKTRYRRRRKNGVCTRCEGELLEGYTVCETHWFEYQGKRVRISGDCARELFLENPTCAYTEEPLTIGNMALVNVGDMPKWVTKDVARMRGSLSHDEFVFRCYAIGENCT